MAHGSGLVLVPDWTEPGGISVVTPAGAAFRVLATAPGPGVPQPLRANGIALEPGGTVLCAHLGDERGGIYRLWPDGRAETVVDRVLDGAGGTRPMEPANFVARDRAGRLWITVSTRLVPRALDYRPDAATGYIAVFDETEGVARVLADGLGYANECLLSADEKTLWVNETFGRRLTAFDVAEGRDGPRLANRRTVAAFGGGCFPDGLAELADGTILVTSIVSNRVLRVVPDTGAVENLVEDVAPDHLAAVEAAFQVGEMGRPHLDRARSERLANISNIALGGPDRRTAYLGCLLGDRLAAYDSPVPGRALPHWECDLGGLARFLD